MDITSDATPVLDATGETGWLDAPYQPDAPLDVRLASGQRLRLAAGLVEQKASGALLTSVSFADLIDLADDDAEFGAEPSESRTVRMQAGEPLSNETPAREVFQEIRETIDIRRVARESERVRVSVVTGQTTEIVREPTWSEAAQVRREPVGEVVTVVEDVRTEDGETIIPVYEEILVVERRLVLRERLYVSVQRETTETVQEVTLRHQSIDIERAATAPESDPAGP